jgi:hypothetical protein
MKRLIIGALVFSAGTAFAGPTARLGITYGVAEPTLPEAHEIGPMVGLGYRFLGSVVAEIDYAYLSLLDPDTSSGGVHRIGGLVRADLWRDQNRPCIPHIACTRAMSFYAEAGIAERIGSWQLDAHTIAPLDGKQTEGHVGFGLEIDNELSPNRNGWQLGVRFVGAPRDQMDFLCRGSGCPVGSNSTAMDRSVLVDVGWVFGS